MLISSRSTELTDMKVKLVSEIRYPKVYPMSFIANVVENNNHSGTYILDSCRCIH